MTVWHLKNVDVRPAAMAGAIFGFAYGIVQAMLGALISLPLTIQSPERGAVGLIGAVWILIQSVVSWTFAFGFLAFAINYVGAKLGGIPFRFEARSGPTESGS